MSRSQWRLIVPVLALTLCVGAVLAALRAQRDASPVSASRLNALGVELVRIALAFAQHTPDEVDSYFGPASLRPAPHATPVPLDTLSQRAHQLVDRFGPDAHASVRQERLLAEARALATVIDQRASGAGGHLSFDEEASRTYGMSLDEGDTPMSTMRVDAALAALDRELPRLSSDKSADPSTASDSLGARFAAYRKGFAVPADRRRAVFAAALDGCRARTAARWRLPAGEHLDVKWDLTAPGAWHRYDGGGHSTLTVNPAALAFIDTAVDLACHEGYPGHHVQFLLADRANIPVEDTIALLRSPIAMLREGAANYAVALAFPPDERLRFERETLFPIAGLDPAGAARYFDIRQLVRALEPAIVPILRDYRDGRLSAAAAADRLDRRALVSSPPALLQFVDDLGPYVLGYTTARDRVARHIAIHASDDDRWNALEELLTTPDPTVLSAPAPNLPPSTN